MREQGTQQPLERLTLHIPAALVEQARRQAGATQRSLNRYIVEAIEERISQPETTSHSHADAQEWEVVLAALKQSGLLVQMKPELDGLLSGHPVKTHAEILDMMSGQHPLSEDIIEMRGNL